MKVSILVPVFGVERFIERCARSLFEQTYHNLEYIFIDDGSTDRSIEILQSVVEEYPTRKAAVRIIRHDHNRGLGAARNTALDNATGEFVYHVDSDDFIERDAIRLLVTRQTETDADIITGNALIIYPYKSFVDTEPDYVDSSTMTLAILKRHHFIWNRLIRLSLYNDNEIRVKEGVDYCEDYQQTPRLAFLARKVARIDKITYYYCRDNAASYGALFNEDYGLIRDALDSYRLVEEFFSDKGKVYYNAARCGTTRRILFIMRSKAVLNDREFFQEMKNLALNQYSDVLGSTRLRRIVSRLAISNIHLYKFLSKLYGFYQRCRLSWKARKWKYRQVC